MFARAMENKMTEEQRIYRLAAWIFILAFLFYLFFQVNKNGPLGAVNPFAVDPYDAVGSFAFQIALLCSLLTYARALRLLTLPSQASKTRLVWRGAWLTLSVILWTLVVDGLAEILQPVTASFWGNVLLVELALMFGLTLFSVAALLRLSKMVDFPPLPAGLTLDQALDDLWTLVRQPVKKMNRYLPPKLVDWVENFESERLFVTGGPLARFHWLSPRRHPWRFVTALGLAAGLGLLLGQFREGPPPSLIAGLLVVGIFIFAELAATLAGFFLLGRYLGLR
jgi:hypothetical protein